MGTSKLLTILFNLIIVCSFTKSNPAFGFLNEHDAGVSRVNIQQAENIFIGHFEDTIRFERKVSKNYGLSDPKIIEIGTREDGDKEIANGQYTKTWNPKKDIVLWAHYPFGNLHPAKSITRVEMSVDTDGEVGKHEITGGGIHQDHIFLEIIINGTSHITAEMKMFGFL